MTTETKNLKIAMPESVLMQFVNMLKQETRSDQLEGLGELRKAFADMMSARHKELHEMHDHEALEEEFNIIPADPDDPMLANAPPPSGPNHEFSDPDEIIGELKRRLNLTD